MKNPCYDEKTKTECSKRRVGCRSECAEWQDYLVERGRIYDARNFVRSDGHGGHIGGVGDKHPLDAAHIGGAVAGNAGKGL